MMSNEGYRDRLLTCRDCGREFTFTSGEQEFFASKGLTNTPSRCPSCRAARRGDQSSHTPRAPRGEMYDAICATCGRPTSVPFIPREDRPVYCNDCFQAQRASRPPRREESHSYSMSYSNVDSGFGGGRGRDSRDRRDNGGYGGGRGRDHGSSGSRGRDRRDGGRRERHERWEERW